MKYRKFMALVGIASLLICGCGSSAGDNADTKNDTQTEATASGEDSQTSETAAAESETTEPEKTYDTLESDAEVRTYDSVIVVGDSGYELYNYSEGAAEKYAEAVNSFAESTDAKVYDLIIPLGSGIVFPDNKEGEVGDQRKAMQEVFSKVSDKVNKVDIYDALMSHRSEYIYFRTDHHWTALGAYYAYSTLCDSMGVAANPLESYETVDYTGFIGSFYNDSNDKALKANPDTITAYRPLAKDTATMVKPESGEDYAWNIIYDVTDYPAGVKYSTFIAGDNPLTTITNNEKTDGSSCIVVKESFGNAFVPFLVDHFQTIYVVDYRYYKGTVSELMATTGSKDVIFLNNLSMIRNKYLVGQFQGVVK